MSKKDTNKPSLKVVTNTDWDIDTLYTTSLTSSPQQTFQQEFWSSNGSRNSSGNRSRSYSINSPTSNSCCSQVSQYQCRYQPEYSNISPPTSPSHARRSSSISCGFANLSLKLPRLKSSVSLKNHQPSSSSNYQKTKSNSISSISSLVNGSLYSKRTLSSPASMSLLRDHSTDINSNSNINSQVPLLGLGISTATSTRQTTTTHATAYSLNRRRNTPRIRSSQRTRMTSFGFDSPVSHIRHELLPTMSPCSCSTDSSNPHSNSNSNCVLKEESELTDDDGDDDDDDDDDDDYSEEFEVEDSMALKILEQVQREWKISHVLVK